MKNLSFFKNIIPATAMAFSLGMVSCVGDLDVEPIDPSTNTTLNEIALFNKCYANLGIAGQGGANGDCDISGLDGGTTGFVRQLFNANSLTTDEAHCPWGDEGIPAFNHNQWSASHPMLKGFYYRLYFGVTMCNEYLATAGNYDATMTAEVRFLRALQFYYLMDLYGNIPFMTTVSAELAQQKSRKEVYAWLENELLEIEPLLAEAKPEKDNEEGYGRADKAAAWMLLTRLYLNAEIYTGTPQWENAKKYAKMLMDSPYKLSTEGMNGWTAYQMLFMGDNGSNGASSEAILPVLQDGKTTTAWGCSLFLMAGCYKDDMVDEQFVSGNGTTENWQGNRALPDLVAKFFPNGGAPKVTTKAMQQAAGDDRALFWGKGRTLDIDTETKFENGYSVTKFNNYYATGGSAHHSQFCDTDFFLMRLAEAYLAYAEADAHLNGGETSPQGTAAIDALRDRAHAVKKSTYSLDDILDEGAREFYFEGQRRPALIRNHKFGGNTNYHWQWKGGVKSGVNFPEYLNIFAIPDADKDANQNLEQNFGY